MKNFFANKYGVYFASPLIVALIITFLLFDQKITEKILSISFVEQRLSEKMPEKIWLHRCNSIQRLAAFHNKYFGVEIDIIYHQNTKEFETSHDPEDLESHNLEQIFKYYAHNNLTDKIWLDFKNLSVENSTESEEAMSKLIEQYRINKQDVIIESRDWTALGHYRERGYQTSYYFPYYE